jgi:hypothetical protein
LNGVLVQFQAEGDFNTKPFGLHICRSPEFSIVLSGPAIVRDEMDVTGTSWQIFRGAQGAKDKLELLLELRTRFARVHFENPEDDEDPVLIEENPFAARLIDKCPKRVELVPEGGDDSIAEEATAEVPGRVWRTRLELDSRTWPENEVQKLVFRLSGSFDVRRMEHSFRCVPTGHLEFSRPNVEIKVNDLQYGEVLKTRNNAGGILENLIVTNTGVAAVLSRSPQVKWEDGPVEGLDIRVQWEQASFDGYFDSGGQAEIDLVIDASRASEECFRNRANPTIRACIVLESEDPKRQWELPVVIHRLVPRPLYKGRLAIDFGSTNTYAAIWNTADDAGDEEQVIPVLNKQTPEQFPTVMYFENVSDPRDPQYNIGPEAVQQGKAWPTAVVSMLKRWIGVPQRNGAFPAQRHVWDKDCHNATYGVPELVRRFLYDLIRRCDDRLREKIAQIGVSFPTNFDRNRLSALRTILDDLSKQFHEEDPERQFTCEEPGIDEASAVILGFMLDPRILKNDIRPRLNELERPLVIASIDVGGGTIDTALIRIRIDGPPEQIDFARFASEYLGFGGDSQFGGDNVTVAILEILYGRLLKLIAEAATPKRVEIESIRPGEGESRVGRSNFDALWQAAEQIKFYLCKQVAAASVRPLSAATHRAASGMNDLASDHTADGEAAESPPLVQDQKTDTDHLCEPHDNVNQDLLELRAKLGILLAELKGQISDTDGASREQLLIEEAPLQSRLDQALADDELLCLLDETYDHVVQNDLLGRKGYTIRSRLERCILELASFAEQNAAEVDFIVLAGAGARLPLVSELLGAHEKLKTAQVRFELERAKSKVACGLVRYYDLRARQPERVEDLRSSLDYTPCAIGIVAPGTRKFVELVPRCSPLFDPGQCYPFPKGLVLQHVWYSKARRRIELYCCFPVDRPQFLGTFDLCTAGQSNPNTPLVESKLPDQLPARNCPAVRFRRMPEDLGRKPCLEDIELMVSMDGKDYGYWRLVASKPESQ